jgi:hypothetical protein
METFIETSVMTLEDFYSGRIGSRLLQGETIPLENFDFNNVSSNIIRFRSYFLRNGKPVYTGWIYNGKKISLDYLRKILADVKVLKDKTSTEIYAKKMQYPTDATSADGEIAFLCTTLGRLRYLVTHIEDTIKYMETYNLKYACETNFSSFHPMFADDLALTEYLEIMRNKTITTELKNIMYNQREMKAVVLKAITFFKSHNQDYFGNLDANGDWDFSWLDNATPEDVYNLFMICVGLMKGLNNELSGQDDIYKQMLDLLNFINPKKNEEGRRLEYQNPDNK